MRTNIFKGKNNQWFWNVKAKNNKIVQTSGEGYMSQWGARRAARKFLNQHNHDAYWLAIALLALLALILFILLITKEPETIQTSHNASVNANKSDNQNQATSPTTTEPPVNIDESVGK